MHSLYLRIFAEGLFRFIAHLKKILFFFFAVFKSLCILDSSSLPPPQPVSFLLFLFLLFLPFPFIASFFSSFSLETCRVAPVCLKLMILSLNAVFTFVYHNMG